MATRRYFSHVNPEGVGINTLVLRAGYPLPAWYGRSLGSVELESISAGYGSASETWKSWMGSPPHRRHLLGEESFFATQTSYGIGHYYNSKSQYGNYWVFVTAPTRAWGTLTLDTPSKGTGTSAATSVVSGLTGPEPYVTRTEVRLDDVGGGPEGPWITADVGSAGHLDFKRWRATISGLKPGDNVVRLRSLDAVGILQAETVATVRYSVPLPLTVGIQGSGTVTPGFAGVSNRDLNVSYAISAAPSPGYLFRQWVGLPEPLDVLRSPRIAFVMREGLQLTAQFVPSPFFARSGVYQGTFGSGSDGLSGMGCISVVTFRTGAFSGRLYYLGTSYPFAGVWHPDGDTVVTIPRGGSLSSLVLRLNLDVSGDSGHITGTVEGSGGNSMSVVASRATAASTTQAYAAGRFTMELTASTQPEGLQIPNGFAAMTVLPNGTLGIVGKLPDGTAFSTIAFIDKSGTFRVFVPLHGGVGALFGSGKFQASPSGDLSLTMTWVKPETGTQTAFPAPFTISLEAVGSRYTPPAVGKPVLVLSGASNRGTLLVELPDRSEPLSGAVDVRINHVIHGAGSLPFVGRVNPLNGVFAGSFRDTAGKLVSVIGVVNQSQRKAEGLFVDTAKAGNATIIPMP
jgi:hypothetical protein